ncbi:hypothetical protein GE21DRAFT_1123462 [Neurospora crassa]|nr:hypothetical protein GE21DRAFT_1123462 [Neurospora crassa]
MRTKARGLGSVLAIDESREDHLPPRPLLSPPSSRALGPCLKKNGALVPWLRLGSFPYCRAREASRCNFRSTPLACEASRAQVGVRTSVGAWVVLSFMFSPLG